MSNDQFTTDQMCELRAIERARVARGGTGLRAEVQELIDRLTSGGVAGNPGDHRAAAAKRLWDIGVGRELGYNKFADYLATVPQIPGMLITADERFPHLVLVETWVGLKKLCDIGRVAFSGDDETLVPFDDRHKTPAGPYWIRMQDGRKNRNRKVRVCRDQFNSESDEGPVAECHLSSPQTILTLV